jgi:hypothetical protein
LIHLLFLYFSKNLLVPTLIGKEKITWYQDTHNIPIIGSLFHFGK